MRLPICKAWASEWGLQIAHLCLQVYGGYGYTCEYPAEQYMRDAEIACIYEGTNGIQALDFVARKLPMDGGKPIRDLLGLSEPVGFVQGRVAVTVDQREGRAVLERRRLTVTHEQDLARAGRRREPVLTELAGGAHPAHVTAGHRS